MRWLLEDGAKLVAQSAQPVAPNVRQVAWNARNGRLERAYARPPESVTPHCKRRAPGRVLPASRGIHFLGFKPYWGVGVHNGAYYTLFRPEKQRGSCKNRRKPLQNAPQTHHETI